VGVVTGLDWLVLVGTIGFIAVYGAWKTRHVRDMDAYFRAGNTLSWPTIGLGIMATQASAITFLSTPGQAYEDGMRFVQFYFGLPLAMIVISAVFVPIYYRLKVYTAYEYLEHRFDVRVRWLGAALFLVQRGLAAGITIYAPSIILSAIMGWSLGFTTVAMGLATITYTVSGGTAAVGQTQKQQMVVMLAGMVVAAVLIVLRLPDGVSLPSAIKLAGALDRMNVVRFELDPNSRYTFWSGITGGFFLALSYFGTDQSQVQRYLSGRSVTESRLGLLFNGMLKIPMQFVILFTGVMVFVFYLFTPPPIFFNAPTLARVAASEHGPALAALQTRFDAAFARQRDAATAYVAALDGTAARSADTETAKSVLRAAAAEVGTVRAEVRQLVARAVPGAETKDTDYVFLSFVLGYVPRGLVGLLVAVILCAAMSSIAAELTALGSTTTIDFYKRVRGARGDSSRHDLLVSKLFTVFWGLVAVGFAAFASLLDNLIEAVNILGSIFYGTVLGLFVVAFFVAYVSATPVLVAALVAQAVVIVLFFTSGLGFLWYNVIGCAVVVVVAIVLEAVRRAPHPRCPERATATRTRPLPPTGSARSATERVTPARAKPTRPGRTT
jgi:Na+/proline symporter